ncbi:MAG: autotransporter domain-containing protein [Gammaproteobacteria bacterium]|nr:autotransporter domain-containing protein [Gammaproteobacteria bacterium]
MRILVGVTMLALGDMQASEVQVCSDSDAVPSSGTYWLKCTKGASSTDSISINGENVDIDTMANNVSGIHGKHEGTGDITINITSGGTETPQAISTIATTGSSAYGIQAEHTGMGDITIDVSSNGMENPSESTITTTGLQAHGIFAHHGTFSTPGSGDIEVKLRERAIIDVSGRRSRGIRITHDGEGNVEVTLESASAIRAQGDTEGDGIAVEHYVKGNVTIDLLAGTAINASRIGVYQQQQGQTTDAEEFDSSLSLQGSTITSAGRGIWNTRAVGRGDARTTVKDSSTIVTTGRGSYGIYTGREGLATVSGDVIIDVRDSTIRTESTATNDQGQTASYGIQGYNSGTGNVDIDVQDGSITTAGAYSHGIYGLHEGTGDIDIALRGPITVSGAGARGVQMGRLSGDAPGRVAGLDANGYRRQTVTVNGAITSAAEGVFLAGGGRVILGPSGSITSGSDIAILATGTVPAVADDPQTIGIDESMAAIAPKLRVDLNPGGAQMAGTGNWLAAALGGGWILNDGGGTAIYVNGEKLHDADTGVVANAVARNGAWDVTMQAQGVKVSDRSTDPWTFSARAAGVIADRDFNAEDFMEVAMVARCPAGMVGTPPNCTTPSPPPPPPPPPPDPGPPEPAPEPGSGSIPEFEPAEPAGPVLVETYAPRAALYEALPEFLLGLHTQAGALHSLRTPDLPVWMELSASTGEHDPARSTVGAHFDAEHLVVRAGGQILQGRHHRVRASVHHVSATADVSSPVRGGDLRARGKGLSLDAHYHHGNGSYATGRAAWTDYTLEASSDTVGRLVSGVEAERMDLRVETGHRLHWGAGVHWSPHLRLHHTRLSVERFTDAVGARVSFPQTERYRASLGLMADRTYGAAGGQGVLWGALHLEHAFRDTDTRATVSGETLEATPEQNRVHLSAGLLWEYGPWVLESALAWHRANADSQAYAARLNVGVRF